MADDTVSSARNKKLQSVLLKRCTLLVLSCGALIGHPRWGVRALRQSITKAFVCLSLIISLLPLKAQAEQIQISGTVQDSTGAVIPGSQVSLTSSGSTQAAETNADGRFSFSVPAGSSGIIRVVANGFAAAEQNWTAATNPIQLTIVLQAGAGSERIVVSAARSELKLSEVPGSAVQLTSEDISANPSLNTDDMLRQVPGFSLFRRSSSRIANPTTLDASLRGLGGSGPSQALVLEDRVPLVDPFNGWIYWDQLPRTELASVEVFRGDES